MRASPGLRSTTLSDTVPATIRIGVIADRGDGQKPVAISVQYLEEQTSHQPE